jgi:hypothetical protein
MQLTRHPAESNRRSDPGRPISARGTGRYGLAILAVAALGVVIAACGSTPSAKPKGFSLATTTTAPAITTPTVTINGQSVNVPTEEGTTRPIGGAEDTGEQIIYTAKGFLPQTLYAFLQQPVTWTNLSSAPLKLTVEGMPTVTVAPGGTYQWVPNVLQFQYKAANGDWGLVHVGAFSS